ncbi:MAG: GTP-binding protein [Asgard group archaeon]|nr:GTP-binding protein [Asgard group archaeon]
MDLAALVKLIWKIVIIGDPAVGKTSIRRRYLGETTSKEYIYTIGADFATKRLKLSKDLTVQYQIFDLAGQPKFDKVRSSFYAGIQAAVLVYDITSKESLIHLPKWVLEAKRNNDGSLDTFIVVGNKIDLKSQKETDDKFLKKFLQDLSKEMGHGILHIYTSALTGENIDILFKKVTEKLLETTGKENPKIAKIAKTVQDKIRTDTDVKTEVIRSKPIIQTQDLPVEKRIERLELEINLLKLSINDLHSDISYLKNIILRYLNEHKLLLEELNSKSRDI